MKSLYAIFAASCLLLVSSLGTSCSDNARSCEVDDDCFGGEACVAGVCQSQSSSNDADPDDADSNNNSSDTDPNNNSNDAGPDDTGSSDADSNNGGDDATNGDADSDAGHTDTCEVDPFTVTCNNDDDYDNDEWLDADPLRDGSSIGCPAGAEQPEEWARRIEGKICYDEAGDFYRLQVAPCDTQFRLEVKMTVPEMCTEEEFRLNASFNGGGSMECNTEKDFFSAQCERDGNVYTWTLLIKPYDSIWSLYFGAVGSDDENISSQFDYTLDAKIF